jgi:hydrogenase expression/formation protein HypC
MCLAIPVQIVSIENNRAKVFQNGVEYEAGTALVEDLQVGDWVLMHAGFILEKIDEDEAKRTIETFREYSNLQID